ncbi:ATP-binding cassette domain-containing protein, partial [Halorubrum saccharovorum]|uniref:ATP-binding cassette domain-containing protein n=1 Tax=Halorubrum saccharovorum TaxID=2248 RepID=UPI00373AF417
MEVSDLSVSFGDVPVVSGVDFRVERGSLTGLVGPNGAGKTTVLRAIKGTLSPDAGEVQLDGDPTDSLSAREAGRRVASVPQETSLAFDFRVRQIVEMGRTPHLGRFDGHGPDDERAVREAIEAAGVARFADRAITEVSGGERQRVLLARALAQETPSLLLDEPTASLDVNHAVRTLELVRDLVDDGRAALAAIHDLDMAARYCDRIVLLANGGVRAVGPPAEVLTADALRDAFDAEAFVGESPATGTPTVTAFDGTAGKDPPNPRRVHVVGSGRPAGRAVARLAAAG